MDDTKDIRWIEVTARDVEGKGWTDTCHPFSRVPKHAEGKVPQGIWELGESSTGMSFFFRSNATKIRMRWTLSGERTGEDNFNVNAYSGFSLYAFDTTDKAWRWMACPPHFTIKYPDSDVLMISGLPKRTRDFRMYLPMRNRPDRIEIGVEKDADFALIPPRTAKPLVWYGTSIIHGAFSIHSGLGITQIMGRRLDIPTVNLGFSGAARLEEEMADLLAELNPRAFVIDPIHNIDPALARSNALPFLEKLCARHPDTPVIFLGAPPNLHAWFLPEAMEDHIIKTSLCEKACRTLRKTYPLLTYVKGDRFYGSDREVSMDGVHPNDLAFQRMADELEPRLRKILSLPKKG